MDLKAQIRKIPDFPKKGILFYDITTLLKDPAALKFVIDKIFEHYLKKELAPTKIVATESRGFIFGAPLAYKLHAGFVPVRKPGKLPAKTVGASYKLEYGENSVEMHADAVEKGERVLIVDDVLATGGTAKATADLVEKCGGKVVGLAFLIELGFLHGRDKLKGYDVFSLVNYEKEE